MGCIPPKGEERYFSGCDDTEKERQIKEQSRDERLCGRGAVCGSFGRLDPCSFRPSPPNKSDDDKKGEITGLTDAAKMHPFAVVGALSSI